MTLPPTPDLGAVTDACWALWDRLGIHDFDAAGDGDAFTIDMPPPYASAAHLHVGHAMSYAQAEFIARYRRMRGERVLLPMGFDDNGLPTERYVERKFGIDARDVDREEFRRHCLAETAEVIGRYRSLWRALGLSVDWRYTYSTIDDHCRRTAQQSFLDLHAAGRVERRREPVFWDPVMGTALAAADLDTVERTTTLYEIAFGDGLVIATTRPELLPACVALYANADDERYRDLGSGHATVPLFGHAVPVRFDDEVDPDFGTGLMMVCTFGDTDDVRRWQTDRLDTRLVIDERGLLTDLAGPYAGLFAEEARRRIVADLETAGALVGKRAQKQRVAVSDRSGAPVEHLMRPQWFLRVLDLKDELLARCESLEVHPDWMAARLRDWIEGLRYDWNLSRQRRYGVPIPAWLCLDCGGAVVARPEHLPVDPLIGPPPSPCQACGSSDLEADPDVFDTWMTSSLTPDVLANAVGTPGRPTLADGPMSLRPQAHDIIRTWLFYTVLKTHLHHDRLPWRQVMISGWGLNEQGKRISKRDLNPAGGFSRYDPDDLIERYGADALRWWAARARLGTDVRYAERDVKAGRKVVLKLWNAARLVESWDGSVVATLPNRVEDRWLLGLGAQAVAGATEAFDAFDYAGARAAADELLTRFTDDWLELAKDRIWQPEAHSPDVTAQGCSVARTTLRTLLSLYAPFLPYVTESIFQALFEPGASLHATTWPVPGEAPDAEGIEPLLAVLAAARATRTAERLGQGSTVALAEITTPVAFPDGLEDSLRAATRSAAVTVGIDPIGPIRVRLTS